MLKPNVTAVPAAGFVPINVDGIVIVMAVLAERPQPARVTTNTPVASVVPVDEQPEAPVIVTAILLVDALKTVSGLGVMVILSPMASAEPEVYATVSDDGEAAAVVLPGVPDVQFSAATVVYPVWVVNGASRDVEMLNVTAGVIAGLVPRRAAGIVRVTKVSFATAQVPPLFVSITMRLLVAVVLAVNRQKVLVVRVTVVPDTLGLKTAATDGVRVIYTLAAKAEPVVNLTVNVVGVEPTV